jgi:hypothetical protein
MKPAFCGGVITIIIVAACVVPDPIALNLNPNLHNHFGFKILDVQTSGFKGLRCRFRVT